jgi:uncharacterized membrane protein
MFTTSQDILNLVISICVGLFTVSFCFLLFYLIAIMRRVSRTLKKIDTWLERFHTIVEDGFGHLGLIAEGLKMVMSYFLSDKPKNKNTKSKK